MCHCNYCCGRPPAVARVDLQAPTKISVSEYQYRLDVFDARHKDGAILAEGGDEDLFYGNE